MKLRASVLKIILCLLLVSASSLTISSQGVNASTPQPPSAPSLINPKSGEIIDGNYYITWAAASDPDSPVDSLQYEISLSLDNGLNWKALIPLTPKGITSYSYDFSATKDYDQAKIRIRAYDGISFGPYSLSNNFIIKHKYYYDKYTAIRTVDSYSGRTGLTNQGQDPNSKLNGLTVYQDYSFSSTKGFVGIGPTLVGGPYFNNGNYYVVSPTKAASRYIYYDGSAEMYYHYDLCVENLSDWKKGTILQQNIVAVNGTYPTDGRHTDGYWYIKKAVVNNSPSITLLNATTNINVSNKQGDKNFSLTGSVSDPNGDNLTVSATIDRSTKTTVVTNTSTTKSWVLNWDVVSDSIDSGVYSNIVVTVSDGNGSAIEIYTGRITVVKPDTPSLTSPNGGETIDGSYNITWSPAVDAVDPQKLQYEISISLDGGKNWGVIVPKTEPGETSIKYNFNDFPETLSAKLRIRALRSGEFGAYDETDKTFVINHTNLKENIRITSTDISINVVLMSKLSDYLRVTIGGTRSEWIPAQASVSHTQNNLKSNTKYPVIIELKDQNGVISSKTFEAFTKAQAPLLSVSYYSNTSLELAISDTNSEQTQYQITTGNKYVSSTGKLSSTPIWITIPSKKIIVTGLNLNTPYTFKIKARDTFGEETASSSVGTTISAKLPDVPGNVQTRSTSNEVKLTWNEVPDATGYDIEVDGNVIFIDNGANLSYLHKQLSPNTIHTYRIRAKQGTATGNWSPKVTAITLAALPSAPPNVILSASSTSVSMMWDTVAGVASYDIEVDGKRISVGTKTMYHHTGLAPGTQHTYRIRSKNAAGTGNWSALQTVLTTQIAPTFPSSIAAEATNTSVTLSWSPSSDAEGYEIEADGIVLDNGASTFIEKSGLLPNTRHTYRVRAKSSIGTSGWSESVTVITYQLDTPSNILDMEKDTSVVLTWDAVPNANGYEVEVDGIVIDAGAATSYTHGGLAPEMPHKYRIRAKNANGLSAWSDIVSVSTLPLRPGIPTSLTALAGQDMITLSWDAVPDAIGYDIELDGKVVVDNFNGTTYSDIALTPVSVHTYRVRAKNAAIEGEWSPILAVSTLPGMPLAPGSIVVTSTGSIVTLAWDKQPGATGYDIEVDGQLVDVGTKTLYKHRRLITGTEHTYRIRTKNRVGISDWSGLILNNTITAKLIKGKTVDLGLTASDVTDFSQYTLTVAYDPNAIEVLDLSTLTGQSELNIGKIEGTDITITSFTPGRITFVSNKAINLGESWTGVINSIQFKAKVSGGSPITYTVINNVVETP